jgi:flavin-dependent dehydrogenase
MRKPKIVIVGAGPAGGACALALSMQQSAEVLVLDKSKYPRVKVCGSGLSPFAVKVLERLEMADHYAKMAMNMTGLIGIGPSGGRVYMKGSKGAWVVPRVEFDAGLVNAAVKNGVEFREQVKVTDIVRDADGQARGVKTSDGEIEADLVVCANGSPSRFSTDPSPADGIRTIMGWWNASLRNDDGLMIWDRRLDGYYAWAFPEPGGVVNIGLTIPQSAPNASRLKELFSELLEEHFADITRNADQVGKWMGHPATITTRVGPLTEPRLMFVGEAARLVCPATVEGISFALESGVIAADAITRHFDPERGLSRAGRAIYRARAAANMLPKFWIGEGFHRLMQSERALKWSQRLIDPQRFATAASTLLGERPVDRM